MRNSKYIYKKVEELLESKISAYKIEAETGVNRSTITRLRNDDLNIETTYTKNTLALFDYAIEYLGE
ncbi:hypothetical protein [Staphylococcus pseudoxylosus]|uniref:hypothetical protein n=1 Tax=Staphylococcus pseudoxylosus TaxID=2282419 RepID=UPI002DBA2322|nr:hypothetical protein [Staphylococcus pseudoxylosus]MEB6038206.1 hypothetical protein [Staphylococcus pseudoxylosus]